MEKLGQLQRDARTTGTYDLIVVDTPPSRSALDFLDAPERLSSFLDGRFVRLLLAPARGPARIMTAGLGLVTAALSKILGGQFISDLQTFVAALDTVFGGFRARAQQTYALLQAAGRRSWSSPRRSRTRCARRRTSSSGSARSGCRWPGLVVNRATRPRRARCRRTRRWRPPARLRRRPADGSLTAGLLRLHADRARMLEREVSLRERFAAAHPQVPTAVVPALAGDVHDLDGLARRRCAGGRRPPLIELATTAGVDHRAARLRKLSTRLSAGDAPLASGGRLKVTGRQPAASQRPDASQYPPEGLWRCDPAGRYDGLGLGAGRFEDRAPRGVRTATQQRTTLTLGHAAPHAPLDLVVESLGEALGTDRAPGAHLLGLVLLGPADEELVRLRATAHGLGGPVLDPHCSAHRSPRYCLGPCRGDRCPGVLPPRSQEVTKETSTGAAGDRSDLHSPK